MSTCIGEFCIHNDGEQCMMDVEDYDNIFDEDECDDFEEDEDLDDDDRPEIIECPRCGSDAYLELGEYMCDNCGWQGDGPDSPAWDD